jgi:hypothetical protein
MDVLPEIRIIQVEKWQICCAGIAHAVGPDSQGEPRRKREATEKSAPSVRNLFPTWGFAKILGRFRFRI